MPKNLLSSFLDGLADILEVFSLERSEDPHLPDFRAILISFMALAVAVSFAKTIYPPLIALAMILPLSKTFNVSLRRLAKAMAFIAIFVVAITLPMSLYQACMSCNTIDNIITQTTSLAVNNIIPLLLRSMAAVALITIIVQSIGLMGLIKTLKSLGVPSKILFILTIYIRYIPIMLRQTTKLLSAREARITSKVSKIRSTWFILSTVAGSLLIRGFDKAYKLQLAFKARGLSYEVIPSLRRKMNSQDVVIIALTFILAGILVLM